MLGKHYSFFNLLLSDAIRKKFEHVSDREYRSVLVNWFDGAKDRQGGRKRRSRDDLEPQVPAEDNPVELDAGRQGGRKRRSRDDREPQVPAEDNPVELDAGSSDDDDR